MADPKTEPDPKLTAERLQQLRDTLQKMSRSELREFGRTARENRDKRTSASIWAGVELEEATEEWRRRERAKKVAARQARS